MARILDAYVELKLPNNEGVATAVAQLYIKDHFKKDYSRGFEVHQFRRALKELHKLGLWTPTRYEERYGAPAEGYITRAGESLYRLIEAEEKKKMKARSEGFIVKLLLDESSTPNVNP